MMNRHIDNQIGTAQIGFIKFLVLPLFIRFEKCLGWEPYTEDSNSPSPKIRARPRRAIRRTKSLSPQLPDREVKRLSAKSKNRSPNPSLSPTSVGPANRPLQLDMDKINRRSSAPAAPSSPQTPHSATSTGSGAEKSVRIGRYSVQLHSNMGQWNELGPDASTPRLGDVQPVPTQMY